jgi:hypothetical protein
MQKIINSIYDALENKNWYVALFVTLTLPDICAALEYGESSGSRYADWFEANVPRYKGFISGNDCYALRCALLHQGKDNTLEQKKREMLEHYVFLTDSNSHCTLFENCIFNGVEKSFLQLNVQIFCKDLCACVETWLASMSTSSDIQSRLKDTIKIHEPGYNYMGIITFN